MADLQEIETIRGELRDLRKRIAGLRPRSFLEEADTLLSVTEDLINKVFQSLRRKTVQPS